MPQAVTVGACWRSGTRWSEETYRLSTRNQVGAVTVLGGTQQLSDYLKIARAPVMLTLEALLAQNLKLTARTIPK
jgi:hypothetical protein